MLLKNTLLNLVSYFLENINNNKGKKYV